MDRFARSYHSFYPAKYNVEFSFQKSERLLKIVTVRRRATAGRHKHVDQAKPAPYLCQLKEWCSVARDPKLRKVLVCWLCGGKFALRVVGWDAETGRTGRVGFVVHFFTPRISFRWMHRGGERGTDNPVSSDQALNDLQN